MKIQQLNESNNAGTQKMICDILNIEYNLGLTLEELPDLIDIYGSYIRSGKGNFWIVKFEDDIAGSVGIMKLSNSDYEVRRMYTNKRYRGLGIAQKLMEELLKWAECYQVNNLYLETNEKWKAAHHIYEKLGFKIVEINDLPETFPIVRVATGFYRKSVHAQQGDTPEPASPAR